MGYVRAESDAHRQQGPQNVGRYPQVGPNYQYYGEQAGWLYNPWTDTYQPDPKAVNEYGQQNGLIEEPPSMMDTLAPVAGGALALGLGQQVGQQLPGLFGIGSGGSTPTPPTPAGAGTATPPTPSISSASNVPSGSTPTPNAPSAPAPIVNSSGAEAIGMNADGTYQFADGTSGLPASDGFLNSGYGHQGGIGGYVGAGLNAYNAFNAAKEGDTDEAFAYGARGVAAYGTGGLSELAAQGIDAVAGKGTTNKVITPLLKYNPMTGPMMFAAEKAFGGKSTKDYQRERLEALKDEAPAWYQHMQNIKAQQDAQGEDFAADGWTAGEKWSFEKANELNKNRGTDFITSTGNAETFGDDFLKYTPEQQKEISRRLSIAGLYHSDKGNVLISDSKQDEARRIRDEVLAADPSSFATPTKEVSTAPTPMEGTPTGGSSGPMTANINGTSTVVNPKTGSVDMDMSKARPMILIRNPDGSISYPGEGGAYDRWYEDLQKNKGKPMGDLGGLLGVAPSSGGSPRGPSAQSPQPMPVPEPEKKKGLFGLYY
jgi:hypothetical protein